MQVHFLTDVAGSRELVLQLRPGRILAVDSDPVLADEFRASGIQVDSITAQELRQRVPKSCDVAICSSAIHKLPVSDLRSCLKNLLTSVNGTVLVIQGLNDAQSGPPLDIWAEAGAGRGPLESLSFGNGYSHDTHPSPHPMTPRNLSGAAQQEGGCTTHSQHSVPQLIAALDFAHERAKDLCARNEVLVAELEEIPLRARAGSELMQAEIGSIRRQLAQLEKRTQEATRTAQEILNSKVWKTLVRFGGLALKLTGKRNS